ncbi:remoulade isoform X2 [Osmia lignaria lignaria]|uniref:remoulade isoform X2 n=1 Tax=Osmia lignaria lignaria TaxID=1437193 RepID=UPI00402B43F4
MRATLLLLILIQARGKLTQTCPKYCTCKVGAQAEWLRVKCSNDLQDIKDINIDSVSVELVQLDLSKNNIYAIEINIFKNLTNLRRLNLSQNDITSIGEGCFNGLGNLERLDLSKNQISKVDAYTFRKLPNLKRLDLSGNNITAVRPSLFHDLLILERLKLNDNKLTTLKEGTFYGLKSLKQLDLSNNPWRCDCELYWLSNWIHNSSIKLNPAPKCASPTNVKGQFIKKLRYSESFQCQWLSPTIELRPVHNQVVFVGDSITLKCRAPSITEDKNAKLSWLWYPNTTTEIMDLNEFTDPQKSLSNIKVDNRYLTDSGIVDSSLSIVPVKEEHNGQWNCFLVSVNGNRSKAISIIVISDKTRYCPLAVTKNNKGVYTWPRTVVGWKAELPCEGNHLSLMQIPLKASYQCNITGYWEDLNTDLCPYISHTTKIGISVQNLTEPVYIMLRLPLYYYTGKKLLPVVWDETLNESGGWTSEGCYLRNILNNLIIFHCNRLGYYGLLQDTSSLDPNGNSLTGAKFKYSNPAIYIGSIAAIICLIIISITYIICYTSINMPKKAKHCVINTWFAMALLSFFYSIGIYQTENIKICQGVGLTLHYLSLCSLLWMAVFASNMYKRFSKPDLEDIPDSELQDQPIPKPLLGLYLVGWGIAMIICGISGAINLQEYAGYSYCFLTSGPALVAVFVPAGILIIYLIVFHLLIKCAIQSVDTNAQLSEGTQATENMDLELLESNTNPSTDKNSVHSAQTVLTDVEDSEHSQITQLKGQIIMLILYLLSWITAAAAITRPLNSYIPFDETIFSALYSLFSSSLGIFVFIFYGIARNDVRSQWLKMRCWLQKRKHRCCRTRSISDANPVIPTHSLVQNFVPPLSNSQATQVTSDSNSVGSSRYTNRSQNCNAFKFADIQEGVPVDRKMTNMNLVVLHRQQYRSDNSVTTYIEPTCVEMFYNPHQSGVARKFFRKQRRHTKNNNFGNRKQGDGGALSDARSCISVPQAITKLESNINQTILSTSAKVNNTNIHVELNPINDIKNVNILSDSGGSMSDEKSVTMRFIIGQEGLLQNVRRYNNNCRLHDPISVNTVSNSPRNNYKKIEIVNTILQDSDIDIKTDEEKYLQSVSQQCSLEYSSEIESITQMASEKSDHNLPEICEIVETVEEENFVIKKDCQSVNEFHNIEEQQSDRKLKWLTHSNSMYCLPVDTAKRLRNNYCNSMNDIASFTSSKNCDYLKLSFTDLQSIKSLNLYDRSCLSQRSLNKSDTCFSKINSGTNDNSNNLIRRKTYISSSMNIDCASNMCSKQKTVNSMTDITLLMPHSCSIVKSFDSNKEVENVNKNTNVGSIQYEVSKIYLSNPNTYSQVVKKETSV